ncbi:MAG TPA: siroheme synthase [Ktedonobacter sp.]|nr:siroheme synthase [Ktedonobacter sp.]
MPNYYPVMLDIRGRLAIVVGGDRIAAEKAAGLSASGAKVRVISSEFCGELLRQGEHKQVTLQHTAYEPGDLAGAFVVIAATNDPQLVQTIWNETQERGQLLNIVDVPQYCSFILPSILRREQLTIAVSTEGASPSLAKRIRHSLEESFPAEYGLYLRLASLARTHLRNNGVPYDRRDDFFKDYYASDVLHILSEGNTTEAIALIAALLQDYGIDVAVSALETALKQEKEEEPGQGQALPVHVSPGDSIETGERGRACQQ